ncbi:hypothetical protein EVG20_g6257 [Dentipellis fragilis]|uniref:Laccase n=1 Tax=Dentipellis fragilis TaxID=205917 RepID=A0A4Y9YP74_9AGAM|nr:hypothetical protein EVG20_g6257 [Dentipellis fragilis]
MFLSTLFRAVLTVTGATITLASVGPATDLRIVNSQISPDGFLREQVIILHHNITLLTHSLAVPSSPKGDTFLINVINELTDPTMLTSTSVHWHGLFQHGTNDMDGVSFVTQCPIPSNDSFQYHFSATDQAGTFWYHSHLATQYCDGLRGPLVIYDPDDLHSTLYDVDDESTVLTLADWYHVPAPEAGIVPTFDSTLINGLGRFVNGTQSPLAVVSVTAGKRKPSPLTILDGAETDATLGQRYSFILNANQTVGNYWIRALPNRGTQTFDGGLNSAILRYAGAGNSDPDTTTTPSVHPMLETHLHCLTLQPGAPKPGGVDVQIELVVSVVDNETKFAVNGAIFEAPTVPVLLQILSGAKHASELMPAGSVYSLPAKKTVELNIPGGAIGGGHPVHLHGHNFAVVRSAGSDTLDYENPVWRDTVNIGTTVFDNATIRFTTDNPGPWFLHWCIQSSLNLTL